MNIFTTSIIGAINDHSLREGYFAPDKEGNLVKFGMIKKQAFSSLTPSKKEKFLGINSEKLAQVIANHRPRTPLEKAIFEDNVNYLKAHGFVSITGSSREKLRESIKQAWDQSTRDEKLS